MLAEGSDTSKLPLTAWPMRELFVIRSAFQQAWKMTRRNLHLEDGYTNELVKNLNILRHSKEGKNLGFTRELYQEITRGSNCEDYNGRHINSQPDITIRKVHLDQVIPAHLASLDGQFIECKVIDDNRTINLYWNNGIERYSQGKYSWGMAQSMMIAYVKNNKTINDLEAYLRQRGHTELGFRKDWFYSSHRRDWKYSRRKFGIGGNPGKITLWHVWLEE